MFVCFAVISTYSNVDGSKQTERTPTYDARVASQQDGIHSDSVTGGNTPVTSPPLVDRPSTSARKESEDSAAPVETPKAQVAAATSQKYPVFSAHDVDEEAQTSLLYREDSVDELMEEVSMATQPPAAAASVEEHR